jgi:hypothetical protein
MPEDEQSTEQAAQPLQPGQVAINLTPQGLNIALVPVPTQITIGEEGMNRIVEEWLNSHPTLADALLKKHIEQLRAQRNHLALVQNIKKSRND